jgi:hypothetical protein
LFCHVSAGQEIEIGSEELKMKPFAIQNEGGGADFDGWETFSSRGESDYCSRDGAMALKAKIESYWRDRGQEVTIALHNVGFHPAIRAARYDVRSDMINGMPRSVIGADRAYAEPVQTDDFAQMADLVFE